MNLGRNKDSYSRKQTGVKGGKAEHRDTDADGCVDVVVRTYGISLLIVSIFLSEIGRSSSADSEIVGGVGGLEREGMK